MSLKRRPKEKIEAYRRRIFMSRTSAVWNHHKALAARWKREILYRLPYIRGLVENADGLPCCYCGDKITVRNFSVDHRLPLSRGGDFMPENLQIICRRCNETKAGLMENEFRDLRALLEIWDDVARTDVLRRLRAGGKALRLFMGRGRREASEVTG